MLTPFWEAKKLDFRIYFDVFGNQISNNVLGVQKIKKISILDGVAGNFGPALRNARLLGREKERGQKPLEQDFFGRSS